MIKYLSFSLFIISVTTHLQAQEIDPVKIDRIVARSMEVFDIPGVAVSVIHKGKIIHSGGYGKRVAGKKEPVDEKTLFAIASNTKAFTCAALGMLIDEGKISWNDQVIKYIPELQLYSPYVTEQLTIADMVSHRSGLGLGAGDLMIYPDSNDFSINDVINNMKYFEPVAGFRTAYLYNNQMFILAGEVVARASGMGWEDFIEERIMRLLQMEKSAATFQRLDDKSNVAFPHAVIDGELKVIDRYDLELLSSAGGIYSNIEDMSKWVIMQLNEGKYGDHRLFSQEVQNEMWSPQTIVRGGKGGIYNTHFNAYGFGWRLSDVAGYFQATHGGGLPGMVTQVTLIPELDLGIIVLTNQQAGGGMNAITNTIKDDYLGIEGPDYVKNYLEQQQQSQENADAVVAAAWEKVKHSENADDNCLPEISAFTGLYRDVWFGDVRIGIDNDRLRFVSERSPKLSGSLYWYNENTFIVKWDDRSLEADAFVLFDRDFEGIVDRITMKPASPLTDFSFDFHNLDLIRVSETKTGEDR